MTLTLSILALLLGPLAYAMGQRTRIGRRVLDAAIIFAIAFIIVVHIIPEAIRYGGYLAAVVIFVGLVFPIVLERLFRKATDSAHLVIVGIAGLGLLVHAVIDGIALLPQSGTGLAYAVVLHRLPVGMALWWAVEPNFGKVAATIVFAVITIATIAGYFVGEAIVEMAEARSLAMLQAFVAGSLIHVIVFGVKHKHD